MVFLLDFQFQSSNNSGLNFSLKQFARRKFISPTNKYLNSDNLSTRRNVELTFSRLDQVQILLMSVAINLLIADYYPFSLLCYYEPPDVTTNWTKPKSLVVTKTISARCNFLILRRPESRSETNLFFFFFTSPACWTYLPASESDPLY